MRKGYFTPPVLIILAIIIFAVAILIAINTDLVKRIKKESTPAPSPTTQQPSPTSDETANWMTYRNQDLGFEFKYPKEWIVANEICPDYSSDDLIILGNKDNDCFAYGSLEGSYEFAISMSEQEYDLNETINGREGFVPTGEFIAISGVKAAKVYPITQAFYGRIEIFLNHRSNGLMIVFPNIDYQGNYDSVYDQILSTFQFID